MPLLLFSFLPKAESWCSPSDSGRCELIIRGGRKSTDADQRNIRFLNGKHTNAGAIIVEPMNNEMKFVVGDHADQKPVIRLSKDTLDGLFHNRAKLDKRWHAGQKETDCRKQWPVRSK